MISRTANVLRHPLDSILGSEANVRLLRVLAHEASTPLSATDAARLAGVSALGGRKALARLAGGGLVVRTGSGRAQQYQLRESDLLVAALKILFTNEHERYDSLLSQLRQAMSGIPELRAAWVSKLPPGLGDAMEITVVTEPQVLSWIGSEIRSRLAPLEARFDQVIEVQTLTRADAPRPARNSLVLLIGTPWNAGASGVQVPSSPAQRNERALRLSRAIAELLKTHPVLTTRAIHHLDRLIREGQGTATSDLNEWRQILQTYSDQRLREFLVSGSSRAERLRQSSPFLAVLTPDERDALVGELEREP